MIPKCYQAKANELAPQWYVIDATEAVVGRLASQIAPILMGKHRPTYTPHIDTGDYVIVTNVDKVVFTGKKWEQVVYQRYSGYPGGQKEEVAWKLFQRHPDRILYEAIRRMMPKSKMGRHMMDKLKLYVGPQHPHQAQQPIPLEPKDGRPTPSGILLAPEPAPAKPRARKAKPKAQEAEAQGTLPEATAAPSSIPPASEQSPDAALPPGETQAEAEETANPEGESPEPKAE
ncbi:50S ribosomal protein L13 [Tautonia plasticadhaerens]|uniref:Large ribosomal subunit protein uL13 n=1 Tax=Tautonia plasticadhaerens TaxID=2527974 RepID=A0A518GYV9_9BACT|nr:50S ribosomal protein L13 [Tautonia plasticadhaerens]QDV33794.1 50S ribosomal protein L13 [Tautonia plasticadhaerens]